MTLQYDITIWHYYMILQYGIFQLFLKSDFCNRNNLTFNACLNNMYVVR
jgi:hypothetical protein